MDYTEYILDLLHSQPEMFEDAFVKRNTSDDEIMLAEEKLGFQIPDQFKWYLKEIGHGGCMFEIMGYGLTGRAVFLDETLEKRKLGLPDNVLIIENCDEYYYCINIEDGSVCTWSPYDDRGLLEMYDDFFEFLEETIQDAIDNY